MLSIQRFFTVLALVCSLALYAAPASANFHAWKIKEIYSNADGSIQFIEMFTSTAGQGVLMDRLLTSSSTGHSIILPYNYSNDTANHHLLFATPGFEKLPGGVTPDYLLPCGGFFDPGGDTITLASNALTADTITFGSVVPTDGTNSLNDADFTGANLTSAASSPTNFAGTAGALTLTGCLLTGSCDACDNDEFCDGAETCSGSACAEGAVPCDGMMCDEAQDECFECTDANDCNDDNPCTDDSCNGSRVCAHADNTDACDDDHFCTTTDVCSAGVCVGSGDACDGAGCNEGTDSCGDCADDPDCDDGDYCNGEESCNAGACEAGSDPCDADDQTCNETDDACVNICGNAELQAGEQCDDGDTDDGDGCSPSCQIESGWDCETDLGASVCTETVEPTPDAGPSASEPDAGSRADGGVTTPGHRKDAGDEGGPVGHSRDAGSGSSSDDGAVGAIDDLNGVGRDGGSDGGTGGDDDSGCSCRMVRSERAPSSPGLFGLGLLLAGLRLRRRSRRG